MYIDILQNFIETYRLVASSEYVSEYVSLLLNLASKQKRLFNRIANQVKPKKDLSLSILSTMIDCNFDMKMSHTLFKRWPYEGD